MLQSLEDMKISKKQNKKTTTTCQASQQVKKGQKKQQLTKRPTPPSKHLVSKPWVSANISPERNSLLYKALDIVPPLVSAIRQPFFRTKRQFSLDILPIEQA